MVPPFDIFRHEEDGQVLWIAMSGSMEEAERIVAKAMQSTLAPYAIVSLSTGRQRVIEPNATSSSASGWVVSTNFPPPAVYSVFPIAGKSAVVAKIRPVRSAILGSSLMPDWRELYSTAVMEPNPSHLATLLDGAEAAIFFRLQELNQSPDGHLERREINEALNKILRLRMQRLGWPDFPKS
jgi:hypothetical protein